jgi:hypothetical protein
MLSVVELLGPAVFAGIVDAPFAPTAPPLFDPAGVVAPVPRELDLLLLPHPATTTASTMTGTSAATHAFCIHPSGLNR